MQFIISLKPGSYFAQIARAKNKSKVEALGLTFVWNGRKYQTGILAEPPQEALESPAVLVAAVGQAPGPASLQGPPSGEDLGTLEADLAVAAQEAQKVGDSSALVGIQAIEAQTEKPRGKPGPKPKNP